MSSLFFPITNKLLSSARLLNTLYWTKYTRSLIKKLKSNGPSIDPCGTSAITFRSKLNLLLIWTFYFILL